VSASPRGEGGARRSLGQARGAPRFTGGGEQCDREVAREHGRRVVERAAHAVERQRHGAEIDGDGAQERRERRRSFDAAGHPAQALRRGRPRGEGLERMEAAHERAARPRGRERLEPESAARVHDRLLAVPRLRRRQRRELAVGYAQEDHAGRHHELVHATSARPGHECGERSGRLDRPARQRGDAEAGACERHREGAADAAGADHAERQPAAVPFERHAEERHARRHPAPTLAR
jgi:hypothetical protein